MLFMFETEKFKFCLEILSQQLQKQTELMYNYRTLTENS